MKDYIPELSEQRMVRHAPNRPIDFGPDRDYIFACLRDVEAEHFDMHCSGLAPHRTRKHRNQQHFPPLQQPPPKGAA